MATATMAQSTLIQANRLWDGEALHRDWGILISGEKIQQVGPVADLSIPPKTAIIDLGDNSVATE